MSAVVPSPPLMLPPRSDDEVDDENNDWTASGDEDRSRAAIGVNLGYFMVLDEELLGLLEGSLLQYYRIVAQIRCCLYFFTSLEMISRE